MPRGMYLKSDGFASNLSAPEPGATLADYCLEHDLPYHPTDQPVPLETFVDYGLDFQRRYVPDLEEQHCDLGGPPRPRVPARSRQRRGVPRQAGRRRRGDHPLRLDAADVDGLSPELVSHSSAHRDLVAASPAGR